MSSADIYLVAAEASGDLLAREVTEELRSRSPELCILGIGGSELAKVGIASPIDISPLSVLGFFEGLKAYSDVVRLADAAAASILHANPKVVVLVDSWGFMLRVARRVREAAPHIKLVKLIGPQVWATRPGRAKTLAETVDHLLCMHDIEVPYYQPHGLNTTVIGNPALSRGEKGDRESFRRQFDIQDNDIALLVLPGSRASEIARVAPALMEAARIAKQAKSDLRLFVSPADSSASSFATAFPNAGQEFSVLADGNRRYDAMAGADIVLACSGTVTSEVAVQGTPMIVAYKTGWITWVLARGLLYSKTHITLLNILNGDKPIVPEFVQTRQVPELIAAQAMQWIEHPEMLEAQKAAQAVALMALKKEETPAAVLAAGAILRELEAA